MITTQKVLDGKFSIEMQTFGSSGEPLFFLHGAGGLMGIDPFLQELGKTFRVFAPHLPGYGESTGAEHIDDVIDAALFYHQLMEELGISSAHFVGHSMGGMLSAEIAALDIHRVKKLVLASSAGFWLEKTPIPDLFATQLDELPALIFHDPNSPMAQAIGKIPEDFKALETMYVERVKRFAMASKFLWPIPDRGLKKRAYRIAAPTLLLWGESDRLVPPAYANEFKRHLRNARIEIIKEAGHMVMYEQPERFVKAVAEFLTS